MPNQTKWYGQRVLGKVNKISLRKLRRVGRVIAKQVKENISVPGPEPSKPGEYPHKQTGQLHDKIDYRMNLPDSAVEVIAGAPYAVYVEKKDPSKGGRPYLVRTLKEMTDSGELQKTFDKA